MKGLQKSMTFNQSSVKEVLMNELSKLESAAAEWLPLICALVLKLIKMFKPWEAGYLARTCLCPQDRSGASSDSSYSPERDKRTAGMTGLGRENLGTGERCRCGVTSRPSMGTKGPLSFPFSLCTLDWICVFIPLLADCWSPPSPFIDELFPWLL